jgi:hypothetical protein
MYMLLHDCREEFRSLVFLDRSTRLQVFKQIYFVLLALILLKNWIQNWGNNLIFSTNFLSLFLKRILAIQKMHHIMKEATFLPLLFWITINVHALFWMHCITTHKIIIHCTWMEVWQGQRKKQTGICKNACLTDLDTYVGTYILLLKLSRLIHRYILR